MLKEKIQAQIKQAANHLKEKNPMVGSITNSVTINFVANTQLAVGASAAMVYLPDEGEAFAKNAGSVYINMGTLLPIYEETLPRTAKMSVAEKTPWVLDPVAIGIGDLRTKLIKKLKEYPPSIINGNASEIISLAHSWELIDEGDNEGPRGVESIRLTEEAKEAAIQLARWTKGAVSVSGEIDLITDGEKVFYYRGGSELMERITGFGCTLGGVNASYAAVSSPLIAALSSSAIYKLAGNRTVEKTKLLGDFQAEFINQLSLATAEDIANYPFELEEV
ncbi:MAG: hydroxyethylthiazole kinase [Atopostipes sp.]|nr:hydroxyethylthiazole kinase [Atopostipes sp.]